MGQTAELVENNGYAALVAEVPHDAEALLVKRASFFEIALGLGQPAELLKWAGDAALVVDLPSGIEASLEKGASLI